MKALLSSCELSLLLTNVKKNALSQHSLVNPDPTRNFKKMCLEQCFSTAGPRPGTGPWHQLYRAARGSPGICHFSFLSSFHE